MKFHLYTFIGSFPWCYALAYVGMKLGASFNTNPEFKSVFQRFHLAVEALLVIAFVYYVTSHWKNRLKVSSSS